MRSAIDWKKRGRDLALLAAIAAFLATTGTYGVRPAVGLPLAFGYWLGLLLVGAMTGERAVSLYYRGEGRRPVWLMFVIVSLVTALAVFLVLIGLDVTLGRLPRPETLPAYFGAVWVVAAAMTGIGYLTSRAFAPHPDAPRETQVPDADPVKKFLERPPLEYRAAELWALSSEDHYLRVHTSLGTELVLMRLADAVRDLERADGLQVHRSWWVARAGLKDAARADGKTTLTLKSDVEVPVSRSYADAVRAQKYI